MATELTIEFITNLLFTRNDPVSPDNYYFEECTFILENIFKEKNYLLTEVDGGGTGGQGCGNVWVAYEFLENEQTKCVVISVTHNGGTDITIEIHCDASSRMIEEFLNSLNLKKNDWQF